VYHNNLEDAMTMIKRLLFIMLCLPGSTGLAATLQVGPGHQLKTAAAAAKAALDGDTIEIESALYEGDTTVWRQNDLTIRGIGGRARMKASGWLAQDKGIWVIKGNNTVIENIEFTDARVSDHNGAGIRHEGSGLTIRNCRFANNENGILAGDNPDNDILIEHSEFDNNGYGEGYTHNIYIGRIRSFTLRFSYSHNANVGHQVKSRARANYIQYNLLADNENGQSSYLLDLPNGGKSFVIGNTLQQGPETENSTLFSYGAENKIHPASALYVINNTFVNDRHTGIFINAPKFSGEAVIANNILSGKGHVDIVARFSSNIKTESFEFKKTPESPYTLPADSPALNAGINLAPVDGVNLIPEYQYQHPMGKQPRTKKAEPDIGAYAFTR
jgi:hypothetical protein